MVVDVIKRYLKRRLPRDGYAFSLFREGKHSLDRAASAVADIAPGTLRARPQRLFVSLTADCSLRCGACHYGRDFMPGHSLPWSLGGPMLEDAAALGVTDVRLYGGEPLLHRDIEKFVARTVDLGMSPWLTTNGLLLDKKIDRLVAAGLRRVSIGMYGVGAQYDRYVGRNGAFAVVEAGLARARARHGPETLDLKLDWLLMRGTCAPEVVEATLAFAAQFGMRIHVNLIHYSLPYFTKPEEDGGHHFRMEDRPLLERAVARLIEAKMATPDLIRNSIRGLRSIPDWLMRGPAMRVPCTERDLIWVGPDGSVQMCYVTFRLGNLYDARLRDLVLTEVHHRAARAAHALDCPNCHCSYDRRINAHAPSRRAYG